MRSLEIESRSALSSRGSQQQQQKVDAQHTEQQDRTCKAEFNPCHSKSNIILLKSTKIITKPFAVYALPHTCRLKSIEELPQTAQCFSNSSWITVDSFR